MSSKKSRDARSYKGNDIDSDGDGKVDAADQADTIVGEKISKSSGSTQSVNWTQETGVVSISALSDSDNGGITLTLSVAGTTLNSKTIANGLNRKNNGIIRFHYGQDTGGELPLVHYSGAYIDSSPALVTVDGAITQDPVGGTTITDAGIQKELQIDIAESFVMVHRKVTL